MPAVARAAARGSEPQRGAPAPTPPPKGAADKGAAETPPSGATTTMSGAASGAKVPPLGVRAVARRVRAELDQLEADLDELVEKLAPAIPEGGRVSPADVDRALYGA